MNRLNEKRMEAHGYWIWAKDVIRRLEAKGRDVPQWIFDTRDEAEKEYAAFRKITYAIRGLE